MLLLFNVIYSWVQRRMPVHSHLLLLMLKVHILLLLQMLRMIAVAEFVLLLLLLLLPLMQTVLRLHIDELTRALVLLMHLLVRHGRGTFWSTLARS